MKVLIIVASVILLGACTMFRAEPSRQDYQRSFSAPKEKVLRAAIEVLPSVGLKLTSSDREVGLINADGEFNKEQAKKLTYPHPSLLRVKMTAALTSESADVIKVVVSTTMVGKRPPVSAVPLFNTMPGTYTAVWAIVRHISSEKELQLISNGVLEEAYLKAIDQKFTGMSPPIADFLRAGPK